MLGLMVIILGSIYFGIATPTEAAAVGALLAGGHRLFRRPPAVQAYVDAFMNTVVISASILFIAARHLHLQLCGPDDRHRRGD